MVKSDELFIRITQCIYWDIQCEWYVPLFHTYRSLNIYKLIQIRRQQQQLWPSTNFSTWLTFVKIVDCTVSVGSFGKCFFLHFLNLNLVIIDSKHFWCLSEYKLLHWIFAWPYVHMGIFSLISHSKWFAKVEIGQKLI